MSNAITGPGFLVQVSYPGHAHYHTVGEVKAITGPEQSMSTVEVTNQSSGVYREYKPTLIDGGTLAFPSNFIPTDATQIELLTVLKSRELMDWQLVIGASGKSLFFQGYVTKWGNAFPIDNVADLNVEVKITGPVNGPSNTVVGS